MSVKKKLWLAILAISLITASALLLSAYYIDEHKLKIWLDAITSGSSNRLTIAVLALVFTSLLTIGLPRQLAAFSAGYCFGTIEGLIFATCCATVACWLTLTLAKHFFADTFSRNYPDKLEKVHHFFAKQTFIKAVIIRFLPFGSNFLTNVLAGIAKSPVKPYVLGSGLGFIPQMYIFALAGSGVKLAAYQQIYVSVALLAVALLLGAILYRSSKFSSLQKISEN